MATQRYISTSFWDDAWIRSLDPSEKFIYLYLMTNSLTNIAGVYEITVDRICFDTGYNQDTVNRVLERFHEAGKAFLWHGYMIIPTWPKHQRWQQRSKIEAGIVLILKELPQKVLIYLKKIGYAYPIDSLSIPYVYPSNYSDTDINLDTDTDRDPFDDPVDKNVDNSNKPDQPAAADEIRDQLKDLPFEVSLSKKQITQTTTVLNANGLPPQFLAFLGEDIRGKPKIQNRAGYLWKVLTEIHEYDDLIARFKLWKPPTRAAPPPHDCPNCSKPFARMTTSRAECETCGIFDYDEKSNSWVGDEF